jgi:hypothetical protein
MAFKGSEINKCIQLVPPFLAFALHKKGTMNCRTEQKQKQNQRKQAVLTSRTSPNYSKIVLWDLQKIHRSDSAPRYTLAP